MRADADDDERKSGQCALVSLDPEDESHFQDRKERSILFY